MSAPTTGAFPRRGELFPSFEMVDPNGTTMHLPDGPTLLVFLRGHWCDYCQAQLNELAHEASSFRSHGLRIVALSTDSAETCRAFATEINSAFPVLSDPDAALVRRLGLLDPAPDLPGLTSYPAVFMTDATGTVQFFYVGRTPADRPSCELLLLAAERMSKTGERAS